MQPTKLIKMLLAFALVGLASAGCDSSCTKIAGDCAQALGHDNTNAVVPIAMYSCLDILCGTWSDKCGDCPPCKDWPKAEISTSSAPGLEGKPTTLVTSESLRSSTLKTTSTLEISITESKKHSTAKTSKHTKAHSTKKRSTTTTQTTKCSTSTSRSTHSPPPTFAPRSPTSFDDLDPLNVCESKCEGMFNSCRDHNKDNPVPSFCRNLICETNRIFCGDCPLCYRDGPTTWPTPSPTPPTPTPAPSGTPTWPAKRSPDSFDPLNTCDNQCEGLFNSCRDHNKDNPVPTFCRNLICQTYQHLCADCSLCYRDGPTTWPTQTPTTSTPPPPPATPTPAPSGPPGPPSKRAPQALLADDPTRCGFGCNINECALVCMPRSFIDSYKKYPGNQWFDNTGAEVSVTLRSGLWKCNAGGCTLVSKTGECWTWCDQYGTNCQLNCKGRKMMGKRGDCWEVCDPEGRHCSVRCNAEKRQCREVCDEQGCRSECEDLPKETCWQVCDPQGEDCRQECSVVGQVL